MCQTRRDPKWRKRNWKSLQKSSKRNHQKYDWCQWTRIWVLRWNWRETRLIFLIFWNFNKLFYSLSEHHNTVKFGWINLNQKIWMAKVEPRSQNDLANLSRTKSICVENNKFRIEHFAKEYYISWKVGAQRVISFKVWLIWYVKYISRYAYILTLFCRVINMEWQPCYA